MTDGFDTSEIDEFTQELLTIVQKDLPKKANKFIRKEGSQLRRRTKRLAEKRLDEKTGNYLEAITRGKPYFYKGQLLSIRVYSGAPHAHLIEYGHRQVTKSGEEVGFVEGYHIFDDARKDFQRLYYRHCEKLVDEIFNGW